MLACGSKPPDAEMKGPDLALMDGKDNWSSAQTIPGLLHESEVILANRSSMC